MRAGSSYTNFVTDGNVRQNAQDFNPDLYNKVGAVKGYPGPDTGVAAAAGNPGPEIVMKGGRSPKPGPNYHSFEDSDDLRAGVFANQYAPVKHCNNNQCGGKRRKGKRSIRKGKRSMRKGKRSMRKGKRSMRKGKRSMKKHRSKSSLRRVKRTMQRGVRDIHRDMRKGMRSFRRGTRKLYRSLRGGSPATVPSGSQSSGYHQYMSNQPFTNSYSAGGELSPSENALANPVLIHPTNNCTDMK